MLKGPIPATKKILEKSGLTIDDIDLFEVNEAFASVVLAWQKETGADMNKVNVNGGAIALGHPLGCSGTKLMATLLNELERTGGRYGLQVMCEGGGHGQRHHHRTPRLINRGSSHPASSEMCLDLCAERTNPGIFRFGGDVVGRRA